MKRLPAFLVLLALLFGGAGLFWQLQDSTSPIVISEPQAVLSDGANSAFPVYLTLENTGEADTLVGIQSSLSSGAMIMGTTQSGKSAIPSGSKVSFAADGAHIMLSGVDAELAEGTFVPITLSFANAGDVAIRALVSKTGKAKMEGMQSGTMSHDMPGPMMHGTVYEVADNETAPEISMKVEPAENGKWRVSVKTENFEFFRPEGQMAKHKAGQGHAHLYLNGLKIQRLYGEEATVGALPPGKHVVSVTLNTNDHRAYAIDRQSISASAELSAP